MTFPKKKKKKGRERGREGERETVYKGFNTFITGTNKKRRAAKDMENGNKYKPARTIQEILWRKRPPWACTRRYGPATAHDRRT